jgi:hypothetical protein
MMRGSVVVLVAVAAVFLGSCGRQGIGEMERESQSIDLENAQLVRAELRMGAGELNVTGGADALMEADFAYNVADWEPEIDYNVSGETGELIVEQGSGADIPLGGEPRNEWTCASTTTCLSTSTCRWVPGRATWTSTASR